MNTYNMFWLVLYLNLLGYLQIGHAQLVNVAEGQTATQIATYNDNTADRALDGNTNSDFDAGSCAFANDEDGGNAWWMVDLGSQHAIHTVIVYSNRHPGNEGFLGYISVRVSNSSDITLHTESDQCALWNNATFPTNSSQTLQCDDVMYGRYVSIHRTGGETINIMVLCEVIVMGRHVPAPVSAPRCPKITIEDVQKAVLKIEAERNGIGLT